MRHKLIPKASILALALLALLASAAVAPTASAAEGLSPGCEALNDDRHDETSVGGGSRG